MVVVRRPTDRPRATHRLLLNTPGLNPRCATKVRSPAAWMLLCGCRLPELACSTALVDLGHELAEHWKDEELGKPATVMPTFRCSYSQPRRCIVSLCASGTFGWDELLDRSHG